MTERLRSAMSRRPQQSTHRPLKAGFSLLVLAVEWHPRPEAAVRSPICRATARPRNLPDSPGSAVGCDATVSTASFPCAANQNPGPIGDTSFVELAATKPPSARAPLLRPIHRHAMEASERRVHTRGSSQSDQSAAGGPRNEQSEARAQLRRVVPLRPVAPTDRSAPRRPVGPRHESASWQPQNATRFRRQLRPLQRRCGPAPRRARRATPAGA